MRQAWIRKRGEYLKVFRGGEKRVGRNVNVWVLRGQPDRRLGVIVAKAAVRKAVRRNRLKRVLRESWRNRLKSVEDGAWVVVSVSKRMVGERELVEEFWRILKERGVADGDVEAP
ncbi:MAG: ribonuclease P protein component [Bacillota bacterium]